MQGLQHPNTRCLAKACDALGVSYAIRDDIGNWLTVYVGSKELHFVRARTPFNSTSMDTIFRDKAFSYTLLHTEIRMPKTKQYLNPNVAERWQPLVSHQSTRAITDDIVKGFGLPVIVKRNSGSHGKHVFAVAHADAVTVALDSIFDQASDQYDPIALAQEAIDIAREYRVLWFRGKTMLVYEKLTPEGKDVSISPFGNPGALAVVVSPESAEYQAIDAFLSASQTARGFEYCGFDVVVDTAGTYWLLEVNGWPGTEHITKHAGDDVMVDVWKRILLELQHD